MLPIHEQLSKLDFENIQNKFDEAFYIIQHCGMIIQYIRK